MNCTECGFEVSNDMNFCPNCGQRILKGIICTKCGAHNEIGYRFCGECGNKLIDNIGETKTNVADQYNTEATDQSDNESTAIFWRAVEEYNLGKYKDAFDKFLYIHDTIGPANYFLSEILIEQYANAKWDNTLLNSFLDKGYEEGFLLCALQIVLLKAYEPEKIDEMLVAKVYQHRHEWEQSYLVFQKSILEKLVENEYEILEDNCMVWYIETVLRSAMRLAYLEEEDERDPDEDERLKYCLCLVQPFVNGIYEASNKIKNVLGKVNSLRSKSIAAYYYLQDDENDKYVNKALNLLKLCADQDDWVSQLILADEYFYGAHVELDETVGNDYYIKAGNQGIRKAMEEVLDNYDTYDNKTEAQILAVNWVRMGYPYAKDIFEEIFLSID